MNLEEESKKVHIDTTRLGDLSSKCNELLTLQKEIETQEEKLKNLKAQETNLSEQVIPNIMSEVGMKKFTLEDGTAVEVNSYYSARIPVAHTDEAFAWLRENGHGDIIKNNVSLSFGKNQDNEAKDLVASLRERGHNVKQAQKVEPMTLKAFVKDEITNGRNVPANLFGLYVGMKTKLKTKE